MLRNPLKGKTDSRTIFVCVIDEYRVANDLAELRQSIMGNESRKNICSMNCDLTDFCLLMHIVLKSMGLLANTSRLSYCNFLKEKVFCDDAPKVRSFNDRANKENYRTLETILRKVGDKFDPASMQLPAGYGNNVCLQACQFLANSLHHREYFTSLREQQKVFKTIRI
jgi:hypothetical protein